MRRHFAFFSLSLLVALLSACGGGGGGDDSSGDDSNNVGSGWITISTTLAYPAEAYLSGSAFISPTWWHCCSGSATDTGVTVIWTNHTTGNTGPANQYVRYSCLFSTCWPSSHTWSATIPIVAGENRIEMTASDPSGNIGRAYTSVYPGPPPPDTIAPTVTSTYPVNGATDVGVNTTLTAIFSEEMDPATLNNATFVVTDAASQSVSGSVIYSGTTATFTPTPDLAYSTQYTARITTGAQDIAGNPLASDYTWSFTTGNAPDTTPPSVTSVNPQDNELCADPDNLISATFSEPIDAATATSSSFMVKNGAGDPVIGNVSSTGSVIYFDPSLGLAYDSPYTATVTTAITDLAGNALGSDFSWDFHTQPTLIGSWQPVSETGAPQSRSNSTAVWTSSEMIVWGGFSINGYLNTGGRYNPATDTWETMSTSGAPSARQYHSAVWTGSEMIVWGGRDQDGNTLNTGGRYDPTTDSWQPMSTTGAPSARRLHTAVWTGSEMIVWGGEDENSNLLNTGARYDPATDSWQALSTVSAPTARDNHTAVWTGSEMIVWGGIPITTSNAGARYDPAADTWQAISTGNAPSGRYGHSAVWTGNKMIVWGGYDGTYTNSGGIYDPLSDSWSTTSLMCTPTGRAQHAAVWSGSQMIVWGGKSAWTRFNSGAAYDLSTDSWHATQYLGAPPAMSAPAGVWSGSRMIIWGSDVLSSDPGTGGLLTP